MPTRRSDENPHFAGFVADVHSGDLQALAHKDLSDKEIDLPCEVCGDWEAPVRCDYPVKEKNRSKCNRRLCRECAVHIPKYNDCDLCPLHAIEAGVVIGRDGFHVRTC